MLEAAALARLDDDALWQLGESLMDPLMEASNRRDYAGHVRDFSNRARNVMSVDYFDSVVELSQTERGRFASRERLNLLRRPGAVVFTWRQRFTGTPGEYLAEMVLISENGRARVDHMMVV